MNSRERVRRAVCFESPDRIPIFHGVLPGAFRRHGQALEDLLTKHPDDCGQRWVARSTEAKLDKNGSFEEFTDEWGSRWRRHKGMSTGEVVSPAIGDWGAWNNYRMPPPPTEHIEETQRKIKQSGHQFFAFSDAIYLFERMQFLRGSENLFIDIAENRQELYHLADSLVDWSIETLTRYIDAGVDAILFGDDWGNQSSLLINPGFWREFFKPRYRRMFEAVKERNAFVYFHTDGWTWDILEDLIELGVDILNPQHHLMGTREVGRRFGGRVCVRSDLDRQHILPFGTPEQVTEHVRETIMAFGQHDGGLILHGEIAEDVPWQNIEAMYQAYEKYGCYPCCVQESLG
ncbi:MAG: hypothetical protein GWP14_09755 [Actinobacteria bacterium]|nr:hypothetical protein [Actinomycetota bacterium]